MPHSTPLPSAGRRRALIAFVNTIIGLICAGLAALVSVFALRPVAAQAGGRWVRAGSTDDLTPDVPAPRVVSVPRVDGWYRERARQTVFVVWDGSRGVRAMSATCTHLGCQVVWDGAGERFHCPCHGGTYDAAGRVLGGPPPRPLDTIEARIDPASRSVMVRL